MQTPQILTSQQCLSCRGCCLFHGPSGDWAPRLMPEDIQALIQVTADTSWLQSCDRIALKCRVGDARACAFLNEPDHHCRMYAHRPFECRLYPFLLSREKNAFKVYAHLSCPAIAEFKRSGVWDQHLATIRAFFEKKDVRFMVECGAACYPDYALSPDEVEEVLSFDPAEELWAMRPLLERALSLRPQVLSGRAFVNMFAWKDFFEFRLEELDGHVCVFADQSAGTFMYWPPLGRDIPSDVIDRCFERMSARNRGGSLTRIENVAEEELKYFDPLKYRFERRGQEYVYARAAIAALTGNTYKSRRGEVNAFESRYAYVFRPYEDADFNACADLFDRWSAGRAGKHQDDMYRHMLAENRMVHRLLLSYAVRLGLTGRVVVVDGKIAAYTFGYALNADVFCVLLEVADVTVKGAPSFIFSRLCDDEALAGYTWVNVMDDFDASDLARTKMSWRPARLESFYAVMRKG
ncbi:MAG: DUF2156 domain-containing protein [Candidatus Omnitrophica bacterium]|nr:DUF2156 domain-containing protein [Candidatus Omnitrophota bacterium]